MKTTTTKTTARVGILTVYYICLISFKIHKLRDHKIAMCSWSFIVGEKRNAAGGELRKESRCRFWVGSIQNNTKE